MIYNGDSYILVSGRKVYANDGILGMGPDVRDGVSEGYDGEFGDWIDEAPFTREEREDIANEMIRRWIQWRDQCEEEEASHQ